MKGRLNESCNVFFTTLSNPTRLAILELLRQGPMSVAEITSCLSQEQSMISHNLKPLVRCGFVFVKRRWKERIYSLNLETMEPLFKFVADHFNRHCVGMGDGYECVATNTRGAA
jgi:DNA-binding transcriptional ArsR family regulator